MVLDAFVGLQGTNIMLLVDDFSVHPQDTSFLQDIKIVHFPQTLAA